jgi:hypothetical protein
VDLVDQLRVGDGGGGRHLADLQRLEAPARRHSHRKIYISDGPYNLGKEHENCERLVNKIATIELEKAFFL